MIFQFRKMAFALAVGAVAACSNEPTDPGTEFTGLTEVAISENEGGANRADTAIASPASCRADSSSVSTAPCPGGHFEGFVTGAVAGTDSSDASNPVANVQVKVFAIQAWRGDVPLLGQVIASTITPADGSWKLPELPAGVYALTFLPPADSKYRGVWTLGTASPASSTHPWRIGLQLK